MTAPERVARVPVTLQRLPGVSSTTIFSPASISIPVRFACWTTGQFGAVHRTITRSGKICWVGSDCRVWMGYAQSATQISPPWVDLLLQNMSNTGHLQELTGYMYAQGGDEFYILTRPGFWTIGTTVTNGTWFYLHTPGR